MRVVVLSLESVNNFGIALLSYNHPELTARTIQSALAFLPEEHLFLFHNGSRPEVVSHLKKQFPQVRHFVESNNSGYSGGANRVLSEAFKDFEQVLFLTNDCVLMNLEAPQPSLQPLGLIAPLIMKRKTEHWDSLGGALNIQKYHLRHLKEHSESLSSDEIFYVPGTAFWIDRETWRRIQGFDERFGTYWEDVDLSLRAHQLGLPLLTDSRTIIQHGIGKTCHKDSLYTLYFYQRNRLICAAKNQHLSLRIWGGSVLWCLKTLMRLTKNRHRWNDFPLLFRLGLEVLKLPMLRISAVLTRKFEL
jgi:GT2 family glycosyltransferase